MKVENQILGVKNNQAIKKIKDIFAAKHVAPFSAFLSRVTRQRFAQGVHKKGRL